jgi:putative membrane protein
MSPARPAAAAGWRRLAVILFSGHLALIAFSTLAMLTVLNGPPGPWLQQEPNATVMRIGWAWSGPTYVALGALAALAHAAGAMGLRRAVALFAAAVAISLGAELLGTSTALPFGEYHYSTLLGYRLFGLVPVPIPVSWFYMLYASLAIGARIRPVSDNGGSRWGRAALAGLVLVAWDVAMDPAMVRTAHWAWGAGDVFRQAGLPVWLADFFARDAFYGMPLSNWLGWFLTGTLIARVMLTVMTPATLASRVAPSALPLLLYAANGIMPVALCVRDGLWWAAILGTLAMLVPLQLAVRAAPRGRAMWPPTAAERGA